MTGDRDALLAAIVADPADDTVRLAYADCIEEEGNSARAEFIRVQIEAERLHPDSARGQALRDRAETLFVEHGFRWWVEVCEAVGLPAPQSIETDRDAIGAEPLPAEEVTNRYRQAIVYWTAPGWNEPGQEEWNGYRCREFTVQAFDTFGLYFRPPGVGGFERCEFRRGFPDRIQVECTSEFNELTYTPASLRLPKWATGAPTTSLSLWHPHGDLWPAIQGPHLNKLARLELINPWGGVVNEVAQCPHLHRLDTLLLRTQYDDYAPAPESARGYAPELTSLAHAAFSRPLRRLLVPLPTLATAETLAATTTLTDLTALWVHLHPLGFLSEPTALAQRLALLARSPAFSSLREFGLTGGNLEGFDDVVNGTFGRNLRKLQLISAFHQSPAGLAAMTQPGAFPALEELRLWLVELNGDTMRVLRTASAVRNLRHLFLHGFVDDDADPWELLELVDPERIETLRLELRGVPEAVAGALRERFGGRVTIRDCDTSTWWPREPI